MSIRDRLSFGAEEPPAGPPLGGEPEIEGEEGRNRLFIIIAIGLAGMLVCGLLGIGGYMLFIKPRGDQSAVATRQAVAQRATLIAQQATSTPTATATSPALPTAPPSPTPTSTPTQIATNTPVVPPTNTPVPGAATPTPTWGGGTPDTGIGGLGAVLLAAGLMVLAFVVRRVRLAH
ncbi:MAG TPA: hypothetical protein EYH32_06195 [Anaerolineae bacterium]|nr:hypothetical protein [Anaerolineae bacterium]